MDDVWKSKDGISWTLLKNKEDSNPFDPRFRHTVTSFQGKLFIIGGNNNRKSFNDVWTSEDGTDWQSISNKNKNNQLPFNNRSKHCAFVLNDYLYIIGGYGNIN